MSNVFAHMSGKNVKNATSLHVVVNAVYSSHSAFVWYSLVVVVYEVLHTYRCQQFPCYQWVNQFCHTVMLKNVYKILKTVQLGEVSPPRPSGRGREGEAPEAERSALLWTPLEPTAAPRPPASRPPAYLEFPAPKTRVPVLGRATRHRQYIVKLNSFESSVRGNQSRNSKGEFDPHQAIQWH